MNRAVAPVAVVAHPMHATRNSGGVARNSARNDDATGDRPLPMTASELRAQLRAQQTRNNGVAQGDRETPVVAYEVASSKDAVAFKKVMVLENATDAPDAACRAVVPYCLTDGKGGTLIDPDGVVSAVNELHWRFGTRVDWPALLATFHTREAEADLEAASLIRRLMADASHAAAR